jgi:hypothetical protein
MKFFIFLDVRSGSTGNTHREQMFSASPSKRTVAAEQRDGRGQGAIQRQISQFGRFPFWVYKPSCPDDATKLPFVPKCHFATANNCVARGWSDTLTWIEEGKGVSED